MYFERMLRSLLRGIIGAFSFVLWPLIMHNLVLLVFIQKEILKIYCTFHLTSSPEESPSSLSTCVAFSLK